MKLATTISSGTTGKLTTPKWGCAVCDTFFSPFESSKDFSTPRKPRTTKPIAVSAHMEIGACNSAFLPQSLFQICRDLFQEEAGQVIYFLWRGVYLLQKGGGRERKESGWAEVGEGRVCIFAKDWEQSTGHPQGAPLQLEVLAQPSRFRSSLSLRQAIWDGYRSHCNS